MPSSNCSDLSASDLLWYFEFAIVSSVPDRYPPTFKTVCADVNVNKCQLLHQSLAFTLPRIFIQVLFSGPA